MKLRLLTLLISVLSFFIFGFQYSYAATPLTKVIMTSGSVSEREGAIYVAQEHGFFRKYGVDVSFVQVRNGPVGMAALSSGETQFHWGSVSGANLGAIAEGADWFLSPVSSTDSPACSLPIQKSKAQPNLKVRASALTA